MSRIRSVVKVMNFHSLLRVDKSRKLSGKYTAMENILTEMIDSITNNRNISLDVKTLRVNPKNPELKIYIGSDMGFCGNVNNLVKRAISEKDANQKFILIGRKLRQPFEDENQLLYMTREQYNQDNSAVTEILEKAIRDLSFSKISIVYNHYYNASEISLLDKQIFPIEKKEKHYLEDFSFEGDIDTLLINMVTLYMDYELEIAAAASSASENITRQNVTTESLRKIDERDEVQKISDRRVIKEKEFAKVLDNYTKTRTY